MMDTGRIFDGGKRDRETPAGGGGGGGTRYILGWGGAARPLVP